MIWVMLWACTASVQPELSVAELQDPAACVDCHPDHSRQWSGSMHAYASEDPVFRAMNERGQRETDGELGDFCVQCHAPLALALGETTDGTNLDELPDHLQGVNCYFCHNIVAVEGTHNNPLSLAMDGIMRGGIQDPTPNTGHASAHEPLLDRNDHSSSDACGACHDIVTPQGVHLERTYAEWQETLFSDPTEAGNLSCGECHMQGTDDVAAVYDGVGLRRIHDHKMVGIDVAMTDFPEKEEQVDAVQSFLDTSIHSVLCVLSEGGPPVIEVSLHNVSAGHDWPSGAAQDRRIWVELTAYEGETILLQTGKVAEGEPLVDHDDDANLWRLGDRIYDENDAEVHMFWEAHSYTSEQLPGPTAFSEYDPDYRKTSATRRFTVPSGSPDRVELSVHVRPIGLDLIQSLVESGDLDPAEISDIPTFTVAGASLVWRADDNDPCSEPLR